MGETQGEFDVWRQLDTHDWADYVVARQGGLRVMGRHCNQCGEDYATLFWRHEVDVRSTCEGLR